MHGPGIPLYLSFFYPREYMGVRFGIFLSGSALANAYGGALAYGIARANANISGWRLLFIIEGVPTVLLAAIGFYCLPDRAETARFLNAREREIAVAFAGTQPGEADKNHVDVKKLFGALTDPHNWLFALANFSNNVSFSSLPLFLPTIISNIETFTDLQSNGLSAPPYLLTVFVMIGTTCLFDRVRMRGPFACFFALTAAVGYAVLATCTGTVARYTAVYLVVLIFVTVALVLVWYSNNNMFASRRAGGVWLCGTVLGTNLFLDDHAPYYLQSMWIAFAFTCLAAACCATLSILFWMEKRRRDRVYGKSSVVGEHIDVDNDEFPPEARLRYVI